MKKATSLVTVLFCFNLCSPAQVGSDLQLAAAVTQGRTMFRKFSPGKTLEQKVTAAGHDLTIPFAEFKSIPLALSTGRPGNESVVRAARVSDLIVKAKITRDVSAQTENKEFLFTISDASVEEVLFSKRANGIGTGSVIEVLSPGGRSKINGYKVTATVSDVRPLAVNREYLMILRRTETQNVYSLVGEESFDISDDVVVPIEPNNTRTSKSSYSNKPKFLSDYKAAITSNGDSK